MAGSASTDGNGEVTVVNAQQGAKARATVDKSGEVQVCGLASACSG